MEHNCRAASQRFQKRRIAQDKDLRDFINRGVIRVADPDTLRQINENSGTPEKIRDWSGK